MTLRQSLSGDAYRVHELVDQLLDSEDSLILMVDRRRAISYGEGFGLSPCQLELVANEIERTVRSITTARPTRIEKKRSEQADKPTILAAVIATGSIWVLMAAGIAAFWLPDDLRVFGLVMLAMAIVASLLVLYFNWRTKLRRQILVERDDDQNWTQAARRVPASTDTTTYGLSVSAHHSCCNAEITH